MWVLSPFLTCISSLQSHPCILLLSEIGESRLPRAFEQESSLGTCSHGNYYHPDFWQQCYRKVKFWRWKRFPQGDMFLKPYSHSHGSGNIAEISQPLQMPVGWSSWGLNLFNLCIHMKSASRECLFLVSTRESYKIVPSYPISVCENRNRFLV